MKKNRLLALFGIFFICSLFFQNSALAQSTPKVPTPPFNYLTDPTLGDKVVSVTDSKGLLIESYVWAPLPDCVSLISVNVLQSNGTYKTLYAHNNNPCGSLTTLTDDKGNIAGTQNFDGFGNLIDSQGATASDKFPILLGYRQEQHDPVADLVYMHERWYDPKTGRFISPDPDPGKKEKPASLHKYSYAQNDPINKFDPTGRITLMDQIVGMNQNEMQTAGMSMKQISNLNKIIQNLCKTTSELGGTVGRIADHHTLPKFAGGKVAAKQYAELPEPLHAAIHRLLEIAFVVNGFAPPNQGREAFKLIFQNKAAKVKYLEVIRDVAGYVDNVCKLEQANVKEIKPIFDKIVNIYKDFDF
ncbi:RHS repeat domain-containing protein [Undibacterium sp. Ji42W]|uniref:RHS repeat domain-containing protein n=1 Tax=Undibacterium sp. Ji42W TaxID=3413039 RepID=UPI003BF13D41